MLGRALKVVPPARVPNIALNRGVVEEDLNTEGYSRLQKLEYGFRIVYAGFPSFMYFGIKGRSYSNLLASTVPLGEYNPECLDIRCCPNF